MGKPKFSRKKYDTPSHPWEMERIKDENELIKKYGLKNKREIWKAETRLRKYRGQARGLLAKIDTGEVQSKKEIDQLLMHLSRMSILPPNSTLDDVLTLDTEAILARRLQTLAYIKGLASTPKQARQLISHGHIAIGENKVTIPGYLVTKEEEGDISYTTNSSLNDTMHPARPRGEFSSLPFKKQDKPKEEKPEEPKKEEKPEGEASKEEKPAVEEQTDKPEIKSEEKDETPKEEPKKDDGKPTEENNESETKVEEKTDELKEAKEDKKEESNKKEEN